MPQIADCLSPAEATEKGQVQARLLQHFQGFNDHYGEPLIITQCPVAKIEDALIPIVIVAPPQLLGEITVAVDTKDDNQLIMIDHHTAPINNCPGW